MADPIQSPWIAEHLSGRYNSGGIRNNINNWARNHFAANYSRGGLAAEMFAPTAESRVFASMKGNFGDAFGMNAWFETKQGSAEQIRNLEAMKNAPGANIKKIDKALSEVKKAGPSRFSAGRMLGPAIWIGSVGFGAATAGPGAVNKAQGAVSGAAYAFGADIGSFFGGLAGATVGGPAGVILGKVAGGMIGGAVLGGIAESTIGRANQIVQRQKGLRASELIQDTSAFNTQRAYTMRQNSLAMMNRGENTARSLMGKEAAIIHR